MKYFEVKSLLLVQKIFDIGRREKSKTLYDKFSKIVMDVQAKMVKRFVRLIIEMRIKKKLIYLAVLCQQGSWHKVIFWF